MSDANLDSKWEINYNFLLRMETNLDMKSLVYKMVSNLINIVEALIRVMESDSI